MVGMAVKHFTSTEAKQTRKQPITNHFQTLLVTWKKNIEYFIEWKGGLVWMQSPLYVSRMLNVSLEEAISL